MRATVEQAEASHAEVILVDNGSTDGSAEFVEQAFPGVVVKRSQHNEGFAGGANAGVRVARGNVIVLLNNDAVPEEGWLDALLRALEPEDVTIAASVIDEARFPAAYALGTGTISVIGHPIPNVLSDPTSPFYATGTSLAFKRAAFPEPFDPLFFAYYEDTLLSWRARLRGQRVARAVTSRVRHLGSATARRQPGQALFYWERNKLLTLLLCYERSTLLRLLPLYLFDGVARLAEEVWLAVRRHPSRPSGLLGVMDHHGSVLRAIRWLALHPREIGKRRRVVQAERRISDAAITPLLSGKIFDDHVPTWGHAIGNAVALFYCRLVGIRTAEELRRKGNALTPALSQRERG